MLWSIFSLWYFWKLLLFSCHVWPLDHLDHPNQRDGPKDCRMFFHLQLVPGFKPFSPVVFATEHVHQIVLKCARFPLRVPRLQTDKNQHPSWFATDPRYASLRGEPTFCFLKEIRFHRMRSGWRLRSTGERWGLEPWRCLKSLMSCHVLFVPFNQVTNLKFIYMNVPARTAQGGGGSFKDWKPIGQVRCCESWMAEQIHWWIQRWLERRPIYLSIYLPVKPTD